MTIEDWVEDLTEMETKVKIAQNLLDEVKEKLKVFKDNVKGVSAKK